MTPTYRELKRRHERVERLKNANAAVLLAGAAGSAFGSGECRELASQRLGEFTEEIEEERAVIAELEAEMGVLDSVLWHVFGE